MDESSFDGGIKKKLAGYESVSYDPSDLAALHHQMASTLSWPWYSKYRSELLLGSAISTCTLLILMNQWYLQNKNSQLWQDEAQMLRAQREQVASLNNEIDLLRSAKPDTVEITVVKEQNGPQYAILLNRMANLEESIRELENRLSVYAQTETAETTRIDSSLLTGSRGDVPQRELSQRGKLVPHAEEKESARAISKGDNRLSSFSSQKLSTKTLRDIERHYQQGIGIRMGPVAEFSRGYYHPAKGDAKLNGGLLIDLLMSPSLSLEFGAKYVPRYYALEGPELNNYQLPGVDNSLGSLTKAEIDSWMIETPLNLKYHYPISLKTHWVASLGYSPLIYFKQAFEYNYAYTNNNDLTVFSSSQSNQLILYPGMLNVSVGRSNELKNRKILEGSISYQHSLGAVGLEGARPNFFGIRAAYWFTVK